MKEKLFIYAEQFDGVVDQSAGELVTAAKSLGNDFDITVFCIGNKDEKLINQILFRDTTAVVVDEGDTEFFDEAARAKMISEFLRDEKPSCILVPATDTARPVFARAAAALHIGMTADCTQIYEENGAFLQKKPAFGEHAMVTVMEKSKPALVTLIPGIYPCEQNTGGGKVRFVPVEGVSVSAGLERQENYSSRSVSDAEILISLGRGASSEEAFGLANELADKLGGYVGGTRPLVDSGLIPFEAQVGQTGCTVHPKVCLFFGVSGAIQHTEGVRDCKLNIAVNTDAQAGIFSFADYGATKDCVEVLRELVNIF